jgi:hypothetical protein
MSKVSEIVDSKKGEFVTRIMIATALFAEKFYNGRENDWGKVTSDWAKTGEAQFNDPTSGVYGSFTFAATIKALTGEDIKMRAPQAVAYSVGVAVVPTAPLYGKRSDDGYDLGKAYLCTNETSGGKFRNGENVTARMTNGQHNAVGLMSRISDEVRPATEEEIVALVDALFESKALSLLHDLEAELSRYDAFIK